MELFDQHGRVLDLQKPKKKAYLGNYYRGTEMSRYRSYSPHIANDAANNLTRSERKSLMGHARHLHSNNGLVLSLIHISEPTRPY